MPLEISKLLKLTLHYDKCSWHTIKRIKIHITCKIFYRQRIYQNTQHIRHTHNITSHNNNPFVIPNINHINAYPPPKILHPSILLGVWMLKRTLNGLHKILLYILIWSDHQKLILSLLDLIWVVCLVFGENVYVSYFGVINTNIVTFYGGFYIVIW